MILKVEDVMVEKVVTIGANATVETAVRLMSKNEIGCLVVTKNGRPVGIITERDLLKRVLVACRDSEKTKVWEVMSAPLTFGNCKMHVEDATKLMFNMKIKKLPVIEDGKLVGLVTFTDLVRFQPQMVTILKKISEIGKLTPPQRMKKVLNYYVV